MKHCEECGLKISGRGKSNLCRSCSHIGYIDSEETLQKKRDFNHRPDVLKNNSEKAKERKIGHRVIPYEGFKAVHVAFMLNFVQECYNRIKGHPLWTMECEFCGKSGCQLAFIFPDPTIKRFRIGLAVRHNKHTIEEFESELAKTLRVCQGCNRKYHKGLL